MNVLVAINGSLISENAAKYALNYAKSIKASVFFLHIKNKKDSLEAVERGLSELRKYARKLRVKTGAIVESGELTQIIRPLIKEKLIQTIFCSTRASKRFFERSFSELLTKSHLGVDIAIVKIPVINNLYELTKIGMHARDGKLDPAVFTMAVGLAKSLDTDLVINSELRVNKSKLIKMSAAKKRNFIKRSDRRLEPYFKLAVMLRRLLTVHHTFNYDDRFLKEYLISRNIGLLVLAESEIPLISLSAKNPIEELFHQTPTDCIFISGKR